MNSRYMVVFRLFDKVNWKGEGVTMGGGADNGESAIVNALTVTPTQKITGKIYDQRWKM